MSRQINPRRKLSAVDRQYLEERGRTDIIMLADDPKGFEKQRDMSPEELAQAQLEADQEAAGKRTPSLMDNEMIQQQREQLREAEEDQLLATSEQFDPDDVQFVNSCTVPELKQYCSDNELPKDGNKPELQNRVLNHLKRKGEEQRQQEEDNSDGDNSDGDDSDGDQEPGDENQQS